MKQKELYNQLLKPDPQEVGNRIKQIRADKKLSMKDFAAKIDDKSRSGTVSNWETGKNLPNKKRLESIAEIGEITTNELLYGIEKDFINFIIYISNNIRKYEINHKFSDAASLENYDHRFLVISDIFRSILTKNIEVFKQNNKQDYLSEDELFFTKYDELIDLIYSEYKLLNGNFESLDDSITLVANICDNLIGGVSHSNKGFINETLFKLKQTKLSLDSYALDIDSNELETLGEIDLKIYNSVITIIEEAMQKIKKLI